MLLYSVSHNIALGEEGSVLLSLNRFVPQILQSTFYYFLKYILLIMLLQLSHFFSLLYPPPPSAPPLTSITPPLVNVHGLYI